MKAINIPEKTVLPRAINLKLTKVTDSKGKELDTFALEFSISGYESVLNGQLKNFIVNDDPKFKILNPEKNYIYLKPLANNSIDELLGFCKLQNSDEYVVNFQNSELADQFQTVSGLRTINPNHKGIVVFRGSDFKNLPTSNDSAIAKDNLEFTLYGKSNYISVIPYRKVIDNSFKIFETLALRFRSEKECSNFANEFSELVNYLRDGQTAVLNIYNVTAENIGFQSDGEIYSIKFSQNFIDQQITTFKNIFLSNRFPLEQKGHSLSFTLQGIQSMNQTYSAINLLLNKADNLTLEAIENNQMVFTNIIKINDIKTAHIIRINNEKQIEETKRKESEVSTLAIIFNNQKDLNSFLDGIFREMLANNYLGFKGFKTPEDDKEYVAYILPEGTRRGVGYSESTSDQGFYSQIDFKSYTLAAEFYKFIKSNSKNFTLKGQALTFASGALNHIGKGTGATGAKLGHKKSQQEQDDISVENSINEKNIGDTKVNSKYFSMKICKISYKGGSCKLSLLLEFNDESSFESFIRNSAFKELIMNKKDLGVNVKLISEIHKVYIKPLHPESYYSAGCIISAYDDLCLIKFSQKSNAEKFQQYCNLNNLSYFDEKNDTLVFRKSSIKYIGYDSRELDGHNSANLARIDEHLKCWQYSRPVEIKLISADSNPSIYQKKFYIRLKFKSEDERNSIKDGPLKSLFAENSSEYLSQYKPSDQPNLYVHIKPCKEFIDSSLKSHDDIGCFQSIRQARCGAVKINLPSEDYINIFKDYFVANFEIISSNGSIVGMSPAININSDGILVENFVRVNDIINEDTSTAHKSYYTKGDVIPPFIHLPYSSSLSGDAFESIEL